MVYPVLVDEGSISGELTVTTPKKLTIEFNCLGIETKTEMVLTIDVPLFLPIKLYIEKECSLKTQPSKEILSQEAEYGFIGLVISGLFCLCILYLALTCYNLCNGKVLSQAVPCGESFFSYFAESNANNETKPDNNKSSEMGV